MEYWPVLIGAVTAVIVSAFTQYVIWSLQRKSEERKRTWSLEDNQRGRQMLLLDKRVDEIEDLARALSNNFYEKRLAFTRYLIFDEKNDEVPDFISEIIMKTYETQREFYGIIPMIISIDSKNAKLTELWEKAANIDSDLNQFIIKEPAYKNTEGYDPHLTLKKITRLKNKFNYSLADFYKELNVLQINTLKETFAFNRNENN